MELVIRGAKLYPASRSAGSPSHATSFIYEPDPAYQHLGELYAVVEVLATASKPEAVADLIIESFGKAFYEDQADSEDPNESETSERFDRAVKAVNKALSDFTGQQDATWIGKTSAVVAVAAGKELHITYTGSTEAYLLRRDRLSRIDTRDSQTHQTHRPFTSIASGRLEPGDRIVFATPALTRIVSHQELSDALAGVSSNSAANKIASIIEPAAGAERVAAVIAEVSTPDLVASQPLPEDPAEIAHGPSDNWLRSAKERALPVLRKVGSSARPLAGKAAQAAGKGWHYTRNRVAPQAKQHGLRAAGWLRQVLRNPKKAKVAGVVAVVVLFFVGAVIGSSLLTRGQKKMLGLYDQALTQTREGQQLWLEGSKDQAKTKLSSAQQHMDELQALKPDKKFDDALAKRQHPEFDPASVAGLASLIRDILDQIEGLTRINPKEVAKLTDLQGKDPRFIETYAGKVVVIGGASSPAIATVAPGSGKVTMHNGDTSKLGKVVDTTVTDQGVYLLTDKPAVWLFKPSSGTLTQQSGEWVPGRAIGSYAGNLYVLKDDGSQILKYVKSGSDFGEPSGYLEGGHASRVKDSTSMFVDGSVLTASGSKLQRFFTGTFAQAAQDIPAEIKEIRQVVSLADGDIILALDDTGRIASFLLDGDKLGYTKQYALTSGSEIISITPGSDVTIYALHSDKLVSFTLVP